MAVLYRLLIFAGLACAAAAARPDQPIQAEVQHAQVAAPETTNAPSFRVSFEGGIHAVPTDAPPLETFKLTLDVRFTNQSDQPIEIPDPDGGLDGVAWISMYTLQSQQADGTWKYLVPGGMLVWPGNTKFAMCKPLGPRETVTVKNVPGRLNLE
jgi:hypothetical protein